MSATTESTPIENVFSAEQAQVVQALRTEVSALRTALNRMLERLDHIAPPDEIPEAHLAIMSAVFAAYLGKHVRIHSARVVSTHSGWALAGRAVQHQRNLRRG